MGCFSSPSLLQIYARTATSTETVLVQDNNAVAELLVQILIPSMRPMPPIRIGHGSDSVELAGHGSV